MTEYFIGHKDSSAINAYLNSVSEGSKDFRVLYGIRKVGEAFVDGTLSLDEVCLYTQEIFDENLTFEPSAGIEHRGINPEAIAFIKEMRCMTFYSAICYIGIGTLLTPFEIKLKHEIEHPSWKGEAKTFQQKVVRWWCSRWKHPLVYKEWWLPALVTWAWSIIRRKRIIRD